MMINKSFIGGMAAPASRPVVRQVVKLEEVGGVTADGQMNHLNFSGKPSTAAKKKPTK